MAIFGSLIKSAIEFREKFTSESQPIQEQEKVLEELLKKAKDTLFGKYYFFDNIMQSDNIQKTFAEKVPFFDYHQMNDQWWSRLHEGQTDVSWPGKPSYFALSSGTTGKTSKRIPVTDDMIEAIRLAGIKQVGALSNFDLPSDFFETEFMMLGSSTNLVEKDDHLEGEISGISASRIPFWFKGYYKPGEDIAKIDDWDERVQHIAENAKNWDIGALSGIPSWLELMLKKVIEHHNLDNTVIDTYLASEGFIAFQNRPETTAMKLITDNGIYFEFVPFKPEYILKDGSISQDAEVLNLSQVKTDEDYILIMSTVSGAWRYLIGDTIAFTDVERAEIKITGRTKFFLNVVGSQLSVNKMNAAVKDLEETFDIEIPEYTISAKRFDGEFYHSWYLGTNATIDNTKLAEALDESLQNANKNYKVARGKSLKGVKVTSVSPDVFYEWSGANKKKGGQVKMEKVMGEEKFKDWEAFVEENK